MGGHFGPELKAAGYDYMILEDISPDPVYIRIDDDRIEICDAGAIWGMGSLDVEEVLKKELGEEYEIATIGPGGENGVVFSCISHDFGRQAGRTGVGAVLGSKKVKAIAVRGTRPIEVNDLPGLTKQTVDIINRTKSHPNMARGRSTAQPSLSDGPTNMAHFPPTTSRIPTTRTGRRYRASDSMTRFLLPTKHAMAAG